VRLRISFSALPASFSSYACRHAGHMQRISLDHRSIMLRALWTWGVVEKVPGGCAGYARVKEAGSTGALHHRFSQAAHSGRACAGTRRPRARPIVAPGRSRRLHCLDDGRPGIDPEAGVRLMLAGLLMGIVHDRKLMHEAEVNIATRWFIGYGLHEKLLRHSSLTRIRQRWGEERFRRIFKRTIESCLKAKIAAAEVVHIDASLNPRATTGTDIKTVTADAGYAYAKIYGALERRNIDALIPAKAEPIKSRVPLRRFRYDAKHDILKCPRGCILRPARPIKHGRFFYSKARDCARCPLKDDYLSKGRINKAVVVSDDYPALLRARRRRGGWSEADQRLYQRHRWRSEGFHGDR
jgi:Transposase domain (DUF772)